MKVFTIFIITLLLCSCVAIRESISYKSVFKKLDNIEHNFYKKEVVKYGDRSREYYIFYEPEIVRSSSIIYFIHGGGWKSGSPEEFEYIANYFNNLGYRVILTAYPLISGVDYRLMSKSIFNSYMHVYDRFMINNEKIILGGASAGAHLATMFYLDNYNLDEVSNSVSKIFSLSGVLDFNECENLLINKLINTLTEKDKELKFKLNPVNRLDESTNLDIFLLFSSSDGVVEYKNSTSFGSKAEIYGSKVKYLELNDYTHDESYTYPFINDSNKLDGFNKWLLNK